MPQEVQVLGRVRKPTEGIDPSSKDTDQQIALTESLEQIIAPGSSPYGEITRIGRAFEVHTTAAVAAVVARPTTAHLLAIYNNEPDGGRSYVIDRVWALEEASTSAQQATAFALLRCLGQTRVASLASAGLAINSLNGMSGKDTRVINTTTALDAVTGVAGNWALAPGQTSGTGKSTTAAITTGGGFVNAEVGGKIIVPPGRLFAVHVLADSAGSTFTGGIEWHEKTFTLG